MNCWSEISPSTPKNCARLDLLTCYGRFVKKIHKSRAPKCGCLEKRGYKPKVAVDLALYETENEHGNDPRIMEKARADAEDFLLRVRKGLI